jgi:cytochrome oxidase Cu insertion factor (SCO1/SenC/PrrC family)
VCPDDPANGRSTGRTARPQHDEIDFAHHRSGIRYAAVLQQYATRFNADPARWHFLTGTKLAIAALAIDSLKLTTVEIPPDKRTNQDDLFIHSTIFILVDQRGQLRGIFETGDETEPWTETKSRLLAAIKQLERER